MWPRAPSPYANARASSSRPAPLDCASGRTTSNDRPQTPSRTIARAPPTTSPSRSAAHAPPGSVWTNRPTRCVAPEPDARGSGSPPRRSSRSSNAAVEAAYTASASVDSIRRMRTGGTLEWRADGGAVRIRRVRAGVRELRRRAAGDRAAARPAVQQAHARRAGARARRPRAPCDHARPARARRVGPPARHVALLDERVRPRGRGAARSPRDPAGGGDGHIAGRQRDARGRVAGPGAAARDGGRDAGARPRAARLRGGLHAADARADVRRARREGAGARRTARAEPAPAVAGGHPRGLDG